MEQATIDRLKELEKKATPASWEWTPGEREKDVNGDEIYVTPAFITPFENGVDMDEYRGLRDEDAELICEMRNHLHELLEAKEREMSCNCYKGDRIHHLDDCPAARDERLKAIEPAPAGARTVEQLIDLSKGVLPESHVAHIDKWLTSNEKSPSDVRWGLYPLGMVGRWIERGEKAEAQLSAALSAKEAAERELEGWKQAHARVCKERDREALSGSNARLERDNLQAENVRLQARVDELESEKRSHRAAVREECAVIADKAANSARALAHAAKTVEAGAAQLVGENYCLDIAKRIRAAEAEEGKVDV